MFFCGHDEACTPFNTDGALQRAKLAVEKHYAVVGVLEDLNTTLKVLEHYVPRFFQGATEIYYGNKTVINISSPFSQLISDQISRYSTINRNTFKPPVDEDVKDIVRKNFTKEIEFYEFCKQRMHKQFKALRLPEKP